MNPFTLSSLSLSSKFVRYPVAVTARERVHRVVEAPGRLLPRYVRSKEDSGNGA
jgi:hypothetical protein